MKSSFCFLKVVLKVVVTPRDDVRGGIDLRIVQRFDLHVVQLDRDGIQVLVVLVFHVVFVLVMRDVHSSYRRLLFPQYLQMPVPSRPIYEHPSVHDDQAERKELQNIL